MNLAIDLYNDTLPYNLCHNGASIPALTAWLNGLAAGIPPELQESIRIQVSIEEEYGSSYPNWRVWYTRPATVEEEQRTKELKLKARRNQIENVKKTLAAWEAAYEKELKE